MRQAVRSGERVTGESSTGIELMRAGLVGCGWEIGKDFFQDDEAFLAKCHTWSRGAEGEEEYEEGDDFDNDRFGGSGRGEDEGGRCCDGIGDGGGGGYQGLGGG